MSLITVDITSSKFYDYWQDNNDYVFQYVSSSYHYYQIAHKKQLKGESILAHGLGEAIHLGGEGLAEGPGHA